MQILFQVRVACRCTVDFYFLIRCVLGQQKRGAFEPSRPQDSNRRLFGCALAQSPTAQHTQSCPLGYGYINTLCPTTHHPPPPLPQGLKGQMPQEGTSRDFRAQLFAVTRANLHGWDTVPDMVMVPDRATAGAVRQIPRTTTVLNRLP